MALGISFRLKLLRVVLAAIVVVILCIVFKYDDRYFPKIFTCRLNMCDMKYRIVNETNSLNPTTLPYHFILKNFKWRQRASIDIVLSYAHVDRNPVLKNKLYICLTSLFAHTSAFLHLHIITDNSSVDSAIQVLYESSVNANSTLEVTLYDVYQITEPLKKLVSYMQTFFSYKQGSYYSDVLFFISIGMFKILPLSKVIMVDCDVKFLDDVKNLHLHFSRFTADAVIGIAQEQQPVYRHILHEYRKFHPGTKAGAPPPNGLPGFNSGVLLLDLAKMRSSSLYSHIINFHTVKILVEKYKFKGHLGDQDFYSLMNLDYQKLFYVLPCVWNRQLCQWWQDHGYKDVFDEYYYCLGKISLLHGNCNTFIPS